jgi:hypothetical protein
MEGILVRGRPSGDWTSRQYRWHLRSRWFAGEDPGWEPVGEDVSGQALEVREEARLARQRALVTSQWAPLTAKEASVELVRQWLGRFGPATFKDLKWWTGWRTPQLRAALAGLDVAVVDLGGKPGLVLADDLDPVPPPEPWAALLPSLDPTPMGWKEREWFVGPHQLMLFDRNGNIGPTVWVDGRIVGGWAQRSDGTVVAQLLEDIGSDRVALVEAEVERLQKLMGDIVVKPSFSTPLQRTLANSE